MYYKYGGSHFGTMTDTNRFARMYRSDKLEFVVNQGIWMEGETKFADVILPACTNFERWDISEFANCGGYIQHAFTQCNHRVAVMQHKCIEPLGESTSDYQIFLELATRLGPGRRCTRRASPSSTGASGCSTPPTCRARVSWKDFLKKGYYVDPAAAGGPPRPGVVPLVRRGSRQGHPGAHAAARRLHGGVRHGPADPVGQAGVRGVEPQAVRPRRPGARADHAVRAVLGGPARARSSTRSTRCSSSRRTRATASTRRATARTRSPTTSATTASSSTAATTGSCA